MKIKRKVIWALALTFLAGFSSSYASETSTPYLYPAIEWNYGGNAVPETYWTPWLPLVEQHLTRFKFGFRFSTGTIGVKSPVKITFKYDPANAKSGGDVPIKIKAELQPADYNTFESAFGLRLPNEIQVGFLGITGVPDFLPWFTLPWDFCELLGKIPGLPEALSEKVKIVCSAIDNVGVNMSTKEALPLSGSASYHDKRALLEIELSKFITEQKKQDLAIKIYNTMSDKLGSFGMAQVLAAVQIAKGLNEAGAAEYVTDLCGTAVGKLSDLATIAVIGDPYFTVEGVDLLVNLRIYIPGGKGSGTYPLYFTSSGEEKTVIFRDITPFVGDNDKLKVVVDSMTYRFKLKQGLIPKIGISVFPEIPIPKYEKYFVLANAKKDYGEDVFVVDIPIKRSTDLVQSMRVNPGAISAQVAWSTPIIPLKGTVKVYDGDRLINTLTESSFRDAHSVIVTGLTPEKAYRFVVECQNSNGQVIPAGEISTTTKALAAIPTRNSLTNCNTLTFSGLTASPGKNYIDFTWTTNEEASTEVMFSPSPDLGANYIIAIKKKGGNVIQGWGTREGEREFVTNHSVRITDLEPGTTYYYNTYSWTFSKNSKTGQQEESADPLNRVGVINSIDTLPASPSTIKIKTEYLGQTAQGITVHVNKVGDVSFHAALTTGADGLTPLIVLPQNSSYTFSVKDQPAYQDLTSSARAVVANAEGQLNDEVLSLSAKPSPGGYVYDRNGNPLSAATVTVAGQASVFVRTDAQGHYTFNNTLTSVGAVNLDVSKSGFATKRIAGKVEQFGLVKLFSADSCILDSSTATLNITVKKINGSALSGADLTIKDGNTVLTYLTSDAQGKATFTRNFLENTQIHQINIEAVSSGGAGALPGRAGIPLVGGETQDIEVYCQLDTQGPSINNINIWSGSSKIQVEFYSTESVSQCLKYTNPSGQETQTSWSAYPNSASIAGIASIPYSSRIEQNLVSGAYKIKVKAKDLNGNISESDWVTYNYFAGAEGWHLRVTAKTSNSVSLAWDKFPDQPSFDKYLLVLRDANTKVAVLNGMIHITDINTLAYTFSNLELNKTYQVEIRGYAKQGGSTTYDMGIITFKLSSAAPVIQNLTVTPEKAALKQDIVVSASITDADTNIKKVSLYALQGKEKTKITEQATDVNNITFNHTFQLTKAGEYKLTLVAVDEESPTEATKTTTVVPSEKPVIAFERITSNWKVNKVFRAGIRITNAKALGGELSASVNWGDGKEEALDKIGKQGFDLTHTYQNEGSFTIQATLTAKVDGLVLNSEPASSGINITLEPPQAEFTRVTQDGPNQQTFHIKAIAGSFPIESWTLNLGTGRDAPSGSGAVDKDESYYYMYSTHGKVTASADLSRQPYQAVFTVTDTKGNKTEKTLTINITRDGSSGGAQSSSQQQQTGGAQALDTLKSTASKTVQSKTGQLQEKSTAVTTKAQEKVETVKEEAAKVETTKEEVKAETIKVTTAKTKAHVTQKQAVSKEVETKAVEETKVTEKKIIQKQPLPKIDIKKISLEGEVKGAVPAGRPLMVLVEVNASDDFPGPFAVNLELKKGTEKQKFSEGIEKLNKGPNSFKWDLTGKPEEGSYVVSVEIINNELKLKDKSSKTFMVGEKKVVGKQ